MDSRMVDQLPELRTAHGERSAFEGAYNRLVCGVGSIDSLELARANIRELAFRSGPLTRHGIEQSRSNALRLSQVDDESPNFGRPGLDRLHDQAHPVWCARRKSGGAQPSGEVTRTEHSGGPRLGGLDRHGVAGDLPCPVAPPGHVRPEFFTPNPPGGRALDCWTESYGRPVLEDLRHSRLAHPDQLPKCALRGSGFTKEGRQVHGGEH